METHTLCEALWASDLTRATNIALNSSSSSSSWNPQETLRGFSALHYAAASTTAEQGMEIVLCAAQASGTNNVSTAALLGTPDVSGNSPLHWAVALENFEAAQALVESGADLNQQNFEGETPLFVAVKAGLVDMAKLLIAFGANPYTSTLCLISPLHAAAAVGNQPLTELLLRAGGHIDASDEEGDTPLTYAIREANWDVVAALLAAGADPTVLNEDDECPLELACTLDAPAALVEAMRAISACIDSEGQGTSYTWDAWSDEAMEMDTEISPRSTSA